MSIVNFYTIKKNIIPIKGRFVFFVLLCMFGLFTAITSGCGTIRASQYSAPLKVNVTADLKTDIEVGRRIRGTATRMPAS